MMSSVINLNVALQKPRLFKYIEKFTSKNWKFSDEKKKKKKKTDIFQISAQNIDCGYSLEPPRRRVFSLYFRAK